MNKTFIYCESTEGGMDTWMVHSPQDLKTLYGWMSKGCRKDDENLVSWMEIAEIGDYYNHRLGVMVRVKDEPGKDAGEEEKR